MRVVIVDDEPLARRGIRPLLAVHAGVEVVCEARNGAEAVRMLGSLLPDLVFLDVQMPELDGISVLRRLDPERRPAVIFVTAYDEYAVPAFEVHAFDYLLKPFTDARFREAMQRARDQLSRGDAQALADQLAQLVERRAGGAIERFTVRVGETLRMFHVDEVDWIEADDYYVKLHIGGDAYLVRQTMSALEERLPPDRFIRIHRSTIVNIDRIVSMEPLFQGDYNVILHDGTELKMSRRRREALGERVPNFS
jgi:two-component system, LytTR family, response regulator